MFYLLSKDQFGFYVITIEHESKERSRVKQMRHHPRAGNKWAYGDLVKAMQHVDELRNRARKAKCGKLVISESVLQDIDKLKVLG